MKFIEVTPVNNANVKEKMLIQVAHIMSIAPSTDVFYDQHRCKILVPGMMFEVEESYDVVRQMIST